MSASVERRPVIGFLLNSLFDGYEDAIWRGVIHAAQELDADLVAVLGGALGEPADQFSAFDLLGERNVDGVVVVSPAVGFLCGPAGIAALLRRLGRVPAVSISERLEGFPSITVDNGPGASRVVEHLAAVHGRRRIAFVRGPDSSTEAQVRYQAYRDALARAGLPFDPSLVVAGDHWAASGIHAVRTLLDERKVSMDALVSSNDLMAITAMEELRRRGIDVPAELPVTGFDDIADAASTAPPLTTARQPLYEMGAEAVRRVLALIRGETVALELALPAQLVVRQSCGCPGLESGLVPCWEPEEAGPPGPRLARGPNSRRGRAPHWGPAGGPAQPPPDGPALARPSERAISPESLAAGLEADFPELRDRLGLPSWATDLVAALPPPSGRGDDRAFVLALERLLAHGLEPLPEPAPWFRVLRALLARARQGALPDHARRLASLFETAHALLGSMASTAERAHRMRTDVETRVLQRMIQPMPLPDDVFHRNLLAALDVLDVRSFFLSRYEGPDLREATLLVAHDLDGVVELETPLRTFAADRLVPGRFSGRRRRAHVVLPIRSPGGTIGFALCEIGSMSRSGYEILMHQISVVLSVNGLMTEVRDQHRQLLETARQAGMAEVAVGALHNVGNLLNSVNVSADEIRTAAAAAAGSGLTRATALLSDHAADLPGFFARDPRAALLPTYLGKAVEDLWHKLARIQAESRELQEKTGLIRDSIRALQDHARGGRDHPVREAVELPAVVRSALEIQHAHLSRWGVQVRVELDGLPPLVTQRAKLVHVIVNLVKNAVDAMRDTPERQRVLLIRGARQAGGGIRLEVKDSGEGIAPADLERVFSYGFTTKRDGHGFGLYTSASYVKQLGGSLSAASDGAGRGAAFTLLLDPEGM